MVAATVVLSANQGAEAQDLPAETVTVVMTEIEPFVVNNDGEPDGFYAEIWDEAAASLGVNYETVWVDSFSELLPALDDGTADVAVAPLAPTAEREANYDFTSAVVVSGPQLAYSTRVGTGGSSLLRAVVDRRVLAVAGVGLLLLVVLAHVIWFFERDRHDDDGDFHRSYLHGVWDGLWWSTVTATTVGYGDKAPKSTGGRIVALVAMLASLFLVAAFVSQITSVLTERRDAEPIGAIDDVSSPIGVLAGSTFAEFLDTQDLATQPYDSQAEIFAAASAGEVDFVVANPFAMRRFASANELIAVEGVLFDEFETFGLPQGSPWREPINQALAKMHASGEIAQITESALN